MSSTIDLFGFEHGHNITIENNHLYLVIKGRHGDVQRINIDALYLWMKELFTGAWQSQQAMQESSKSPHNNS